jgi:Ser/Thr protein kinase RdoA (MazF antagonist)
VEDWLTACLARDYGEHPLRLQPLAHSEQSVVRVVRVAAPDWIVRIRPRGDAEGPSGPLHALAQLLVTLEELTYPAERVVRAQSGALTTSGDRYQLLVTTYLGASLHAWQPAQAVAAEPEVTTELVADAPLLAAIGALLGQLHALEIPTSSAVRTRRGLNAASEVAFGLTCLAEVRDHVPRHLRGEHAALVTRLEAIRRFDDCPHTLIHGDCHPGNIVLTPDGAPIFIDWDAAGWGVALIDLAQLLSDAVGPSADELPTSALHAIIDGYSCTRQLTATERDLLPDAIRFRLLVTLAGAFARRCSPDYQPGERFWGATYAAWERHERRAGELARAVQDRYAQ